MGNCLPYYLLAINRDLPKQQYLDSITQYWCNINYSNFLGLTTEQFLTQISNLKETTDSTIGMFLDKYSVNSGLKKLLTDQKVLDSW